MKFVPKKYMENMDEVFKDSDGYWAYTKKGFRFAETECHTAHGNTQKEILSDIRSMEPCDCDECMGIGHFAGIVEETVEVVEQDQEMDAELVDFKRYTELLVKVYDTKETATAEEEKELNALGYKLKLMGVSDAISTMNFSRLQKQLESAEDDTLELEIFEPALEIRIRDKKTNKIEVWYCQKFNSKKDYDREVTKQYDLKNYFKKIHLFEIEHINLKYNVQVKKTFQFRHKDSNVIHTCKVHDDGTVENTWTEKGIFNSALCVFEHLKLSIKYGDWVVVEGDAV